MPATTQPERLRPGIALSGTKGSPSGMRKAACPAGHALLIVWHWLRQGLKPCPWQSPPSATERTASGGKPGPPCGGVALIDQGKPPALVWMPACGGRAFTVTHRLSPCGGFSLWITPNTQGASRVRKKCVSSKIRTCFLYYLQAGLSGNAWPWRSGGDA